MISLSLPSLPHHAFPSNIANTDPIEFQLDFKTFTSLRRMSMHQQGKRQINRADFVRQLTLYLPDVAARIDENDFGIVHLEVGVMKLATREAIMNGRSSTVQSHLNLISDLFDRADAELRDAIRISYLEALFLNEIAAEYLLARGMLSRPLENALRQTESRFQKLRAC